MNLEENLKQARKAAGITQKALAEVLGVYQKDNSWTSSIPIVDLLYLGR
jgi:transcriptional regulator with XRE-family HTH domain